MAESDHGAPSLFVTPTMASFLLPRRWFVWWLFSLSGSSHGMVEDLLPMSHVVIRLMVDDQSSYHVWLSGGVVNTSVSSLYGSPASG
jgi:hypothetical protein